MTFVADHQQHKDQNQLHLEAAVQPLVKLLSLEWKICHPKRIEKKNKKAKTLLKIHQKKPSCQK